MMFPLSSTSTGSYIISSVLFSALCALSRLLIFSVFLLRQGLILARLSRLIRSRHGSEADRDPIPAVDGRNG